MIHEAACLFCINTVGSGTTQTFQAAGFLVPVPAPVELGNQNMEPAQTKPDLTP